MNNLSINIVTVSILFHVYLQGLKQKSKNLKGKAKKKGFDSDEGSPPPKKPTTHRRMTIMSDSDDE